MNILSKVTWQAMRKTKTRTTVTVIGIILSAAMFMAVTTLSYSLWSYLVAMETSNTGEYFLQFDYTSAEHVEALSQDDRVSRLGDLGILGYTTFTTEHENGTSAETCAVAAGDQAFYDMVSITLEEGRLPQSGSEIVISRNIYHYLATDEKSYEVGDSLTLSMVPVYEDYDGDIALPADGAPFTKTYTIVGIAEYFTRLNDYELYLSHLFTYDDGSQTPLWHRAYIKTHIPKDSYTLLRQMPEGISGSTNEALLEFYGATKYNNYNTVIAATCGVLIAIIMTGSVSLIYNAFSISVAERTKQFGLLSSVGATRKQIRSAVFSEAMIVSLLGIPLGLLCGYGGIAVTLRILAGRIDLLFAQANGGITLRAVLSPIALIAATAVALITVLISAAIPACRATRITPLEAIRQKNDYRIPKRQHRTGRLAYRLFGLPGMLSAKYYKVSRKKYRATVISLVISIVLFISAASITQSLQQTVDRAVDTENYDMQADGDTTQLDALRSQEFVADSAYVARSYYLAYVPDEMRSAEFLEHWDALQEAYPNISKNVPNINLLYLEDAVLEQYLQDNGISPEPYFGGDVPTALVCSKEVTTYLFPEGTGEVERYTYAYDPFQAEGALLQLHEDRVPSGLDPFETEGPGTSTYTYSTNAAGEPILSIAPIELTEDGMARENWEQRVDYLIHWETGKTGALTASYYRCDTAGKPAATPDAAETVDAPSVRIGKTVKTLPFGISSSAVDSYIYTTLILPMSAAPEELRANAELCFNVSDYTAAKAYLNQVLGENNYWDHRENEENNRTLLLIINVFSYGFIVLICLICIANVFNTISTNVALRRRDFGMLRSTGFRERDVRRMMYYECLTYGAKALLWGLPISLMISYLIYGIDSGIAASGYLPPWGAIAVAAISVFTVVFATMFYAVSRLRKDVPIDAIRMENL